MSEEVDDDWRNADFDVFLATRHQGQGIGRAALRDALRHAFTERGHHRASLYTSPDNARAIRAYTAIGFQPVGIVRKASRNARGEWEDELMMDVLAEDLR
jgi:aminoglycoside 6'-N-acetyltransferase